MAKEEMEGRISEPVAGIGSGDVSATLAEVTVVFVTLDPEGYTITLSKERLDHILYGHPEMGEIADKIQFTVMNPELIQRDRHVKETYYYYRLTGRSIFRRNDIYINVVVSRDEKAKTGFVKTAFLVKVLDKNGETVWMNRK